MFAIEMPYIEVMDLVDSPLGFVQSVGTRGPPYHDDASESSTHNLKATCSYMRKQALSTKDEPHEDILFFCRLQRVFVIHQEGVTFATVNCTGCLVGLYGGEKGPGSRIFFAYRSNKYFEEESILEPSIARHLPGS